MDGGKVSAGSSLFFSVRVETGKISGGVEAAVLDLIHSGVGKLTEDLISEGDIVVRDTNGRAENGDKILGAGAKGLGHGVDGGGDDIAFGAFSSGVGQGDGPVGWVKKEDGAAIGSADEESDGGIAGGQSVNPGYGLAAFGRGDDGAAVAMRLFSPDEMTKIKTVAGEDRGGVIGVGGHAVLAEGEYVGHGACVERGERKGSGHRSRGKRNTVLGARPVGVAPVYPSVAGYSPAATSSAMDALTVGTSSL